MSISRPALRLLIAAALLSILAPGPAWCAGTPEATPAPAARPVPPPSRPPSPSPPRRARRAPSAPGTVHFGTADLFRLLSSQGVLDPAQRAELAMSRLEEALRDPQVGPEQVKVVATAEGARIDAGPIRIVEVTNDEAAAHDSTPVVLADLWADLIRREMGRRKSEALSVVLIGRFLLALLYPVMILLGLWVGLLFLERIRDWIHRRATDRLPSLQFLGLVLLRPMTVKLLALRLLGALRILLYAGLGYAFLLALFVQFPATQIYAEGMVTLMLDLLARVLTHALVWLPRLAAAAIILLAGRGAFKIAELLFNRVRAGRLAIPPLLTAETASISEAIVQAGIILLAVTLLALLIPGESGWPILVVLLLAALVAALAVAPIARQAAAGILLAYVRPAPRGSRVDIDGTVGVVARRSLLHTIITTDAGAEVWVPNHAVLGGRVTRIDPGRAPADDGGAPSSDAGRPPHPAPPHTHQ